MRPRAPSEISVASRTLTNICTQEVHTTAHSTVSSAGAIESIVFDPSCEGFSVIEDEYQPPTDESQGRAYVVVTRKDGTKAELLPLLRNVVEYWRRKIYEEGS
jgi:hypothetical protein